LAEFASKEELTRLIGHHPKDWSTAALKELVDNALDAAERAGVVPVIDIVVDAESMSVSDNGPGIATETIERTLDYAYRTSSNSAYVSPSRGQQGNALQTMLAMVHALRGKPGVTIIESRGFRHRITFDVDPISREPRLDCQRVNIPATPGTKVTLLWPMLMWTDLSSVAIDFICTNPHLTLSFTCPDHSHKHAATNPDWRKWTPTDPTSAYWYDVGSLKTLLAAEINKARRDGSPQRTVADFLATTFRGLSGTAKRRDICEKLDAARQSLEALFDRGDLVIKQLLDEMKASSRPVTASDLGVIGEEHVSGRLDGEPASRRYKKVEVEVDGVPYLIECGFSYRPNDRFRLMVAAINWSASVNGDPFQGVDDQGLEAILTEQRAGRDEPIGFFLHVATPRPVFLDKGKKTVNLPVEVDDAIVDAVQRVTAQWCKQRKAEERHANAAQRRRDAMTSSSKPMTIRAAAFAGMAQAYAKASDNGTLPANGRQIFYAARPEILRLAERDKLDSGRFTQEFLVDYMNEHPDECAGWNVVFDDRGHLTEPHTGREIGLGTLAVRDYVNAYTRPEPIEGGFADPKISTRGPEGRYSALLYIEKEGFGPLLDQAKIGDRFDLALMSCKGMSVSAARELVDKTCARFELPLYMLHDFDVSGFSIASTLHQSNRRYQFNTRFKVVDFGLRLEDVERLGLQSEPVSFGKVSKDAIRNRLEINGATEREIEFLLTGPDAETGQRVELNAMTSRQFIDFMEFKIGENDVGKVIPSATDLANAYRLFARGARARRIAEEALAAMPGEEIVAPADLAERVSAYLAQHPEEPWDAAVAALLTDDGAH
jgi:DNA topoisomerase VI subunit B